MSKVLIETQCDLVSPLPTCLYTRYVFKLFQLTRVNNLFRLVKFLLFRFTMVLINIDSFVVLVSGKFPCFLEIDLLFILNYKSATKLAKIYSTGNAMFIPTHNKRTNALVKNLRHCSNMSRRECDLYLSGLRINITLIQAISCVRYRVEEYRFL